MVFVIITCHHYILHVFLNGFQTSKLQFAGRIHITQIHSMYMMLTGLVSTKLNVSHKIFKINFGYERMVFSSFNHFEKTANTDQWNHINQGYNWCLVLMSGIQRLYIEFSQLLYVYRYKDCICSTLVCSGIFVPLQSFSFTLRHHHLQCKFWLCYLVKYHSIMFR